MTTDRALKSKVKLKKTTARSPRAKSAKLGAQLVKDDEVTTLNADTSPTASKSRASGKSKQDIVLNLLKTGASLDQLAKATGWQKHSIRGLISGTIKKKLKLAVTSEKNADGQRIYRLADA